MHTITASEFQVPCIRDLTYSVTPIRLHEPVLNVLERFQSQADLVALPVMDNQDGYFGIISRRNYLNLMTRAFARELYSRKKIDELLAGNADIFASPMIVDANDRIDQVIVEFLNRDPNLKYEALPVLSDRNVLGVVKIADMMQKLSESQGQLIQTMQRLSARLNQEVAHAAALQRNLLRPAQIQLPGLHGLATLITSSEIGGDFYDYYLVDKRWAVILIGDVSGHGIAAGTIVYAAKAGVNILEQEKQREPKKILSRLSHIIYNTAHQNLLMTMFALCIDTRTGELRYANAGHQFAYLYRPMLGQLDCLEIGGLPLGKSAETEYEQAITEIDLGDKLFLYTDSIVEEENANGECFGYDRLEAFLIAHGEADANTLNASLLHTLTEFLGRSQFDDDMTLCCLEHYERTFDLTPTDNATHIQNQFLEHIYIQDSVYRANPIALSPTLNRQDLIFLAEQNFSDLIPSLAQQGVRRVLRSHASLCQHFGTQHLLEQHQASSYDDLMLLMPNPEQHREFYFSHSDEKTFIINEVDAWLQELGRLSLDRLDSAIFLLDELIENGLYGAPRDGKNNPLYSKGTARELVNGEKLKLTVSLQNYLLGISLTDSWGTLTPKIFLNRLVRHTQGAGLDSGIGGGGLYLIWRMSDYLQIRVHPLQQTQVSAFIDLAQPFEPELDKSFQFLYHSELCEVVIHEEC